MSLRSAFLPMHSIDPFPAVAWDVEPPVSVYERHAPRLSSEVAFGTEAEIASVEASRAFRGSRGAEGWIRFPSPVPAVGGRAWARIASPARSITSAGAGSMPSLIFCHGIGMEPEFWKDQRLALNSFVESGIRVIRPEAPWHGRRRAEGCYGGEPILARGPGGLLDYFHAAVRELGTLIAWARATRGGPVALAGVSLGALTAQLVATAATNWPRDMRPDALFLIAPSISITRVTFEGSLTQKSRRPGRGSACRLDRGCDRPVAAASRAGRVSRGRARSDHRRSRRDGRCHPCGGRRKPGGYMAGAGRQRLPFPGRALHDIAGAAAGRCAGPPLPLIDDPLGNVRHYPYKSNYDQPPSDGPVAQLVRAGRS